MVSEPIFKFYYSKIYKNYTNIDNVIWIDPKNVKGFYMRERYSQLSFPGIICVKKWDEYIFDKNDYIKKSEKYNTMKEHFIDNISWEDKVTFKNLKKMDKLSLNLLGYGDYQGALVYHEKYEKLLDEIRNNGFKQPNKEENISPMYVNIGENGEFYWTEDGNHRFLWLYFLILKYLLLCLDGIKIGKLKRSSF